jgi:chorismate dehydratase
VSNRRLDEGFVREFNEALGVGLSHIGEIVDELQYPLFDLRKYYRLHLSYRFDDRKRKGMEHFLKVMRES